MLEQRRFRTLAMATLIAAATLLLASCGGSRDVGGGANGDGATAGTDATAASPADAGENGAERVIHIHAEEVAFHPSAIDVKVGETVRLVLDNHDRILHDYTVDEPKFVVLDSEGGAVHDMDEHMAAEGSDAEGNQGAMAHSEGGEDTLVSAAPLHIAAEGSSHADLVFRATAPGNYVFYCSVPGHRQAGMEGVIRVSR